MKKAITVKIQSNRAPIDKNIDKHLKSIIKKLDVIIENYRAKHP